METKHVLNLVITASGEQLESFAMFLKIHVHNPPNMVNDVDCTPILHQILGGLVQDSTTCACRGCKQRPCECIDPKDRWEVLCQHQAELAEMLNDDIARKGEKDENHN